MNWDYLSDIMKTLGHPTRLRLIAHLCEGDDNVGAMAQKLGFRPAAVSQQLSILRMRGLVSKTQVGGHAVYTLEEPQLRSLLDCAVKCSHPRAAAPRSPFDAGNGDGEPSWTDHGLRAAEAGVKQ